jgi:hypothetical protein
MDGYTRAVCGQQLGKHVPVASQQISKIATVGYNNERAVSYMIRAEIL